jgi:hypothetical protein
MTFARVLELGFYGKLFLSIELTSNNYFFRHLCSLADCVDLQYHALLFHIEIWKAGMLYRVYQKTGIWVILSCFFDPKFFFQK